MKKNILTAALVVAAGTAIWGYFALKSSENRTTPRLTGWMQNFTPTERAKPAPRLGVRNRDGNAVGLDDFRGKVVLINFWATWCGPCIREMPSLVRLQAARGGSGFTVIGLSQDPEGWPVVVPFLKKYKLAALPVYVDENTAVSRAMGIRGLPTSVLIDREGREIGRLAGLAEWDSAEALALIDFYVRAKAGG